MASVVLGIAGSFLGPVGGFIGAALGGYIDSKYLFPVPDLEGPLAAGGGLKEMRGSEGMPFAFAFGEQVRVPAKVVWIGPKDILFNAGTGEYFNHVAIDLCQSVETEDFLVALYANGQLVWAIDTDLQDTQIFTMSVYTQQTGGIGTAFGIITSAPGLINLTQYITGQAVFVSDVSSPAYYNTSYTIYDVGVFNDGLYHPVGTTYLRITKALLPGHSFPQSGSPVVTESFSITQQPPPFSPTVLADVLIYNGGVSQQPDALMVSVEGAGKVPARRGRCTAVIQSLNITKFGNQMPNFEAVVRPHPGMTLAEALNLVLGRSGNLAPSDWDTSRIFGDFDGAAIEEPVDSLAILQIIMLAYRLDSREVGGVLVFYHKDTADQVAISSGDLAAMSEGGEPAGRLFKEEDVQDSVLPYRYEVQFSDLDNKLEPAVARDTGTHVLDGSRNVKRIRLPLSMTRQRAARLAKILMLTAFAERQRRALSLPPSYRHISEGDELLLSVNGDDTTVVVKSFDYGKDGLLEIQGNRAQPHIDDLTEADSPAEGFSASGEGQIAVPPATILYIGDIAPLSDNEAETAGFHLGTPLTTTKAVFVPVLIYRSLGPGLQFELVQSLHGPIGEGLVTPNPSQVDVSFAYLDEVNTITVTMFGDLLLETVTPEELIGGANMAYYGEEVIAFRTATFLGDEVWELTGLLRGLRGTEGAINKHSATVSEYFVLHAASATQGTIKPQFHAAPISAHGTTIEIKPVPNGTDIADAVPISVVLRFGSLMPFPVYNIRAVRNSASDLTLTWDRQTRRWHHLFAPVADPLLEPAESYEIDVLKSGSVIATYSTVTPSFSYTSAQQVSDGGMGSGTIEFEIYQLSATIGRGKVKEITI